jgi:hypothetical protein
MECGKGRAVHKTPLFIMNTMMRKTLWIGALLSAGILAGCGTSSPWPHGSKYTTQTGVAVSGYPGGQPKDPGSPALASSTEVEYAHEGPKVPMPASTTGPRSQPATSPEGPSLTHPQ